MRHVATLILALTAAPVAAQNIGESFRCPGPEGLPDVMATVGRTDLLSELAGAEVTPERTILHLQLLADGPDPRLVPHAPFDEVALAGCTRADGVAFDRAAFADGLDAYREAVRTDDAGFFQIPPAEAYWLTIGALAPNGG
ncbi:hypothetical protein MWU52_13375 [Jannaschia sp. S6380]|uniref:hypothetical protein n=1 Tax=Jannaschia sp. S6380 TaxID=2926408 RepID=UPI001FF63924|nr:hypothetical protein [Jannaschia sp. S6380]MCK0168550.1 hypothetical protein [Jannaschia sp. S6380]